MVNERGLVAAPVVLWALVEDDLGCKLPEEDAIRLARYIVARYGAYQTAIEAPGIRSMALLRRFFDTLPWWTLLPAPALVSDQPGKTDPKGFGAAAQSEDGNVAVIYAPNGGTVDLNVEGFSQAQWFDPRTGTWSEADNFTAPDDRDWLLVVRRD